MYDAIVLAGGAARRLGGADKATVEVGGVPLLERVLAAVADAERVVAVGPTRPTSIGHVRWCREDPPAGGPVAALAAALPLTTAPAVLVLAADLPWIAPAVPVLLAQLGEGMDVDAALLADATGRVNHLAGAWRRDALRAALHDVGDPHGAAVRSLTSSVRTGLVPDRAGWGRDCDTWDDIDAAERAYAAGRGTGPTLRS